MCVCVCVIYLNNLLIISKQTRFLKKERSLIRQDNTIYKFSIHLFFSSIASCIEQDGPKIQKQISK